MELETWHATFNPEKFLSEVNLDELIEHNSVYNKNKTTQSRTPCILCQSNQGHGLLLNDKSYLCKSCFAEVSKISYPEKYEANRRKYLEVKEAKKLALKALTDKYGYKEEYNVTGLLAWLSIGLVFIDFGLIIITVILFLISFTVNANQKNQLKVWQKKKEEWEALNPDPINPILRHFHDPQAQLTAKDYKVLKVFNNWPGYPPFWKYLRKVVLDRDGHHCQVSGCPSRVTLHIHHQTPVSKGGEHTPNNLVTLCDFHHALEPDDGHEKIWDTIKTRYFTVVRSHERSNRADMGRHNVRAHVRRLELANENELNQIKDFYSLACPSCSSKSISIEVSDKVHIYCCSCSQEWVGLKELTEETGPRIAELLSISRNCGTWKPRWDMLSSRTKNIFKEISSISENKYEKNKIQATRSIVVKEKLVCPNCGSSMRLRKPTPEQKWKKFWGCNKYRSDGCKGSRPYKS